MIVKPNQSFLDVIIQGCGSMEGGMQVCADNGLPLSYFPAVKSNIMIRTVANALGDPAVLKYLGQNSIVIGTKGDLTGVPLITETGSENLTTEDGGDVLVN